jgi:hypothetical protein
MRKLVAVVAIAAVMTGGAALLPLPAYSATSGDTTATFTLAGGALSISVPGTKSLGSGAPGDSAIGAQLGTVSVSDVRGVLLGTWTATVSSTAFVTGGSSPEETIANDNVKYWSGLATTSSGTGVFTPGQATAAQAVTLNAQRTAFVATGVVGNNSVSWNPTVSVTLPSAVVVGTYTGTITHSVA